MPFPSKTSALIAVLKGVDRPATRFGLSTLLVFTLVLVSSWSWAITEGDVCQTAGSPLCVTNGAIPCSSVTCSGTGTGYQCNIGGGQHVTEIHYKLTIPKNQTSWPVCRTGNSGQSCGSTWEACGTTYHYPTPDDHCTVTCTGTWLWLACQASGSACGN
jgi:hypothetical protein